VGVAAVMPAVATNSLEPVSDPFVRKSAVGQEGQEPPLPGRGAVPSEEPS
jgi:hypothetical protein